MGGARLSVYIQAIVRPGEPEYLRGAKPGERPANPFQASITDYASLAWLGLLYHKVPSTTYATSCLNDLIGSPRMRPTTRLKNLITCLEVAINVLDVCGISVLGSGLHYITIVRISEEGAEDRLFVQRLPCHTDGAPPDLMLCSDMVAVDRCSCKVCSCVLAYNVWARSGDCDKFG